MILIRGSASFSNQGFISSHPLLRPAMGFANVYFMRYSYVSDHFQYPASLGLIVLFAAAATQACLGSTASDFAKRAAPAAAAALLAVLGLLTWRQSGIYENSEKLWADTVEKNPSSWAAQNNLGYFLTESGRYKEAEEHLSAAVRLKANYSDYSDTYNNLGLALERQGRFDEAAAQYQQAIVYAPGDFKARCNLGEILAYRGKFNEAIAQYRLVLDAIPDFAVARQLLDSTLAAQSRAQSGSAARR